VQSCDVVLQGLGTSAGVMRGVTDSELAEIVSNSCECYRT